MIIKKDIRQSVWRSELGCSIWRGEATEKL